MPIKQTIETKTGVPIYIYTDEIEPQAKQQLIDLAESGIAVGFVAAMPDVHHGKGATIGTVYASDKYVCPNAVGVDIGCGMAAVPLIGLKRQDLTEENLRHMHGAIKRLVPTGIESHAHPRHEEAIWNQPHTIWLESAIDSRTRRQIGTLGGGNHFIELVYDRDNDDVFVMLHSGSRNIGKRTAEYYNEKAASQMMKRGITLANKDLNHLIIDSQEGQDYLLDMTWCQHYAEVNRQHMLAICSEIIETATGCKPDWENAINIHHNFCALEEVELNGTTQKLWITRKGATSAQEGKLGLIPGSMATGSFVVRGKGNPKSWSSCSHGAGRVKSRTAAKKDIKQEDFVAAMAGIVCETDPELRDEAPQAYKDINKVMENQSDLVDVERRLLPLLNVKGYEKSGLKPGWDGDKIPVLFTAENNIGQPLTVTEVQVNYDRQNAWVPVGDFKLRLKPRMEGTTRELWIKVQENEKPLLVVARITEASELFIRLRIDTIKKK